MSAFWARLLDPIVWRLPGRPARKLFAFALAEDGSCRDLWRAAALTPSEERAALYLAHADDEARHARMFAGRSEKLRLAQGKAPFGSPRADIEHLFERLGEEGFLAFVHYGEKRARAQLEAHRDFLDRAKDHKTRDLIDAILVDERRHEAYTWEQLVLVAGGEREARAALRRAARWALWRAWRRAGRSIAGAVYAALMAILYVLSVPFALLVMLLRPARPGWHPGVPTKSLPTETKAAEESAEPHERSQGKEATP